MGGSVCSCSKKSNTTNIDVNLDRNSVGMEIKYEEFSNENSLKTTLEEKTRISNIQIEDSSPRERVTTIYYDPKHVSLIQRYFRKFWKEKVIQKIIVKNSPKVNNSIKNKLYHTSSLRSSRFSGMDDKLKNIIQQLRNPYKIKFSSHFQNKNKEGFCILEWDDGTILKGYYLDNKLNGIAQIKTNDGKIFEGEFKDNRVNGYAILQNAYGTLYEGSWINDQMYGICTEHWKDGTYFQGEYYKGRRNGIGVYRLPDGTLYEGNFTQDSLDGWGIMYFTNNNQYSGQWKDDKMHGYGEYLWNNGRVYIGKWEEDKKSGFGIHYWNDPSRAFVGFWKENKQHGVGCIIKPKLLKYGLWECGERVKWLHGYSNIIKYLPQDDELNYLEIFPKELEEAINLLNNII